jgi:hypothetical protein
MYGSLLKPQFCPLYALSIRLFSCDEDLENYMLNGVKQLTRIHHMSTMYLLSA